MPDHAELTRRFTSLLDGTALTDNTEVAEALAIAALRPTELPGEPVWGEMERKRVTVVFEDATEVTDVYAGEADRPSAVAALLRQAADDIETTIREAATTEAQP
jgi:hypothetical protein